MDDSEGKYASKTKFILGIMFKILDLVCFKGPELPYFPFVQAFPVQSLNLRSVLCTNICVG